MADLVAHLGEVGWASNPAAHELLLVPFHLGPVAFDVELHRPQLLRQLVAPQERLGNGRGRGFDALVTGQPRLEVGLLVVEGADAVAEPLVLEQELGRLHRAEYGGSMRRAE